MTDTTPADGPSAPGRTPASGTPANDVSADNIPAPDSSTTTLGVPADGTTSARSTGKRRFLSTVLSLALLAGLALWIFWPRDAGGPAVLHNGTAAYQIKLTLHSPKRGTSPVTVHVTDRQGKPAALTTVSVEPVMPHMGHAAAPATAVAGAPGLYRADNVRFFMAGAWEITVVLRGPTGTDQAVFPVLVT
ncbi:FixH family protein [Sinosporangium siamense]|uniref:YtkA-like domain-containing protein n=1 Tax=Sinosporangium siamense TaxID=1367973 RepID=A0A919RQG4_9ACTN|nr:FixH family protein [Sinosporangium siamense]GII97392.1 hypothetical protein Ssi02_76230 [Sinosporangium siamense]